MRNMAKKLTSLFMAVLLTFAVMACVTSSMPAGRAADSGELIEISFVKQTDNSVTDTLLSKLDGETMEDNRWTRLIEQELGYKVVYKWIANDQESFDLKLNAMLASGDLPDVIELNAVNMSQAVSAGLLADIEPIFNEYANDLLKKMVVDSGNAFKEAATINGTWYGLGCGGNMMESAPVLFIREDWRRKTGLDAPKNMDDVINMAEEFKKLAGDGAVGILLAKDLVQSRIWGYGIDGILQSYRAYQNFWLEKDGKLEYSNIQPEYKEAIAKLAEMYAKGLLDPEFSVKDRMAAAEDIVAGRCGMYFGEFYTPLWPQQDCINNDPEADWLSYKIPMADGGSTLVGVSPLPDGSKWLCISKKSEHPEALMKLSNLYADKTYDPDLQEYSVYSNPGGDIEGVWRLSPISVSQPNKNTDIAVEIQPHLESGDVGDLFGETLSMFEFSYAGQNGDRINWGWNRVFGNNSSQMVLYDMRENNEYIQNAFYGSPTPTMETNQKILEDAWIEAMVKIISGQSPVDEFDNAVQAWLNGGGTDITNEVNEWYASR